MEKDIRATDLHRDIGVLCKTLRQPGLKAAVTTASVIITEAMIDVLMQGSDAMEAA